MSHRWGASGIDQVGKRQIKLQGILVTNIQHIIDRKGVWQLVQIYGKGFLYKRTSDNLIIKFMFISFYSHISSVSASTKLQLWTLCNYLKHFCKVLPLLLFFQKLENLLFSFSQGSTGWYRTFPFYSLHFIFCVDFFQNYCSQILPDTLVCLHSLSIFYSLLPTDSMFANLLKQVKKSQTDICSIAFHILPVVNLTQNILI